MKTRRRQDGSDVDVLRIRVGLKLSQTEEGGAYLRREARAHGLSVDGLLEAAAKAAPDDETLRAELVAYRSSRRQER